MRSGLNGRRLNRLAVNATYRELVHAESTLALALEADLDAMLKAALLVGPIAAALSDETAGSATVSPGSEGVATVDLPGIASATVSPGSDGTAVIAVPWLGSATVSPGSDGVADIDLSLPAAGGVYDGTGSQGVAALTPLMLGTSSALAVVTPAFQAAVIAMATRVSPLAIPAIPASYAAPPVARRLDIGHREALVAEAGQRDLRVANARDEALAVEDDAREFEIADSRREIEVRHKRRLEP